MQINELHQAALELARAGVPVFVCLPDTKVPATAHGFHDATTDPAVIDKWFAEEPRLNVAYCPHTVGEGVIDLDGGDAGQQEWFDLQLEHGFAPSTKTVRTPRDGLHIYFRGELSPTQHKLGAHIDTRGVGSYVLVPPSVVGGKPYTYESGAPLAPVPEWIPAKLAEFAKARVTAAVDELDLPGNVSRARALLRSYVAGQHTATEGEGGDTRTFAVACEIMNLGLSEGAALELLETEWNPHCSPPWSHDDLALKVSNAARYAQNDAGAWATEASDAVFGAALDKLGAAGQLAPSIRFKGWPLATMQALPKPDWLIEDVLPEVGIGMLFGPPGGGKTWIAVELAAQTASQGRSVFWIAGEGEHDVGPRFAAWQLLHGCVDLPVTVFRDMPWASDPTMLEAFVRDVKAQSLNADLIVIDTAITMMIGLDENNAKDAGQFIHAVKFLRDQLGAAVLFLHHTGKDVSRGARGSGALSAGCESTLEVELHEPTMSFALHVRRQRSAAKRKEPWYFTSRPLGPSLALEPCDANTYRQLAKPKTGLDHIAIHRALSRLNAVSEETWVTSRVLASEIVPPREDEEPDDRETQLDVTEKSLQSAATRELSPYVRSGRGRGLRWGLPEATASGAAPVPA